MSQCSVCARIVPQVSQPPAEGPSGSGSLKTDRHFQSHPLEPWCASQQNGRLRRRKKEVTGFSEAGGFMVSRPVPDGS